MPMEHPNPTTKIGSKMGGEFTYPKMVPLVLTTTAIFSSSSSGIADGCRHPLPSPSVARITVTLEPPQRGTLVFTVAADEAPGLRPPVGQGPTTWACLSRLLTYPEKEKLVFAVSFFEITSEASHKKV